METEESLSYHHTQERTVLNACLVHLQYLLMVYNFSNPTRVNLCVWFICIRASITLCVQEANLKALSHPMVQLINSLAVSLVETLQLHGHIYE